MGRPVSLRSLGGGARQGQDWPRCHPRGLRATSQGDKGAGLGARKSWPGASAGRGAGKGWLSGRRRAMASGHQRAEGTGRCSIPRGHTGSLWAAGPPKPSARSRTAEGNRHSARHGCGRGRTGLQAGTGTELRGRVAVLEAAWEPLWDPPSGRMRYARVDVARQRGQGHCGQGVTKRQCV